MADPDRFYQRVCRRFRVRLDGRVVAWRLSDRRLGLRSDLTQPSPQAGAPNHSKSVRGCPLPDMPELAGHFGGDLQLQRGTHYCSDYRRNIEIGLSEL